MRHTTMLVLIAAVAMAGSVSGCAKNASERRAAAPTMSERISKESVTGRVNDIGSKYVSIRASDGESRRVRVDDHTKMDQVAVGDQVKAYVSEDGYASTIQRVTE
jgi:Cu/Ag efflux protein CusF